MVHVPNISISNILGKYFRPIALTFCGLRRTERSVVRNLTAVSVPDKPLRFVHRPNRSTLDTVRSLVHHTAKSLDASAAFVRYVFLDCSSVSKYNPQSLVIRKPQQFGCPKQLLAWLSDYLIN